MLEPDSLLHSASIGVSHRLMALGNERSYRLAHLFFRVQEPSFKFSNIGHAPLFGCKIVFLSDASERLCMSDDELYRWLAAKRPVSVWNSNTPVFLFRVWHEQNFCQFAGERSEVNKSSVFSLPDGMKLRFEPHTRDFGNHPPKLLAATVSLHMLFHNCETLAEWLVKERFVFDVDRGTATKGATE